jgi:hypothetical protein
MIKMNGLAWLPQLTKLVCSSVTSQQVMECRVSRDAFQVAKPLTTSPRALHSFSKQRFKPVLLTLLLYNSAAQPFCTRGALNTVEESWRHTNPILHIVGVGEMVYGIDWPR